MRSGLAEQVIADVRSLGGVEAEIVRYDGGPVENKDQQAVPLVVGKVRIADFLFPRDLAPAQRKSLKRVLEFVCEALGNRLLYHGEGVLGGALPGPVMQAARLLRARGTEGEVSLAEIAALVGIRSERLSRLFHSSLGITFSEYLNQVRLDRCRELLKDPRKAITDCAFESGFQSVSQFNRRFKAAEGMTPGQYRRSLWGSG